MKILILGAGQVGSSAAYHLSREEANEVTVVDMRPEVLRELQDRLDIRTVVLNEVDVTRVKVQHRPRLLSDNGPAFLS